MTLVIGLKCSNGIVMGADSAATMTDSMGQPTIRQPSDKLKIIGEKVITGISGPVGLAQRIEEEIQRIWEGNHLHNKKPHDAKEVIRNRIWPHVSSELQAAGVSRNALGSLALQSAICHTLIALPVARELCLFQFNHQCCSEESTLDLPFVSIGSGQHTADPFLAFIKRVYWAQELPNLNQGIFAVYWTLDHAIRITPGGIAGPIHITILEGRDKGFKAHELGENELKDHIEAVNAAEKHLSKFVTDRNQTQSIQEPPKPDGENK